MNQPKTIPQDFKLVDGLPGNLTTNGGVNSDIVSLATLNRLTCIVELTQAVGHATAIAIKQCTNVAAGGVKAVTVSVPIWANEDCAATDTLVRATDAVSYTVTNDIKKKLIVFQIHPADLDVAGGFDCIRVDIADSSQATNFASVLFIGEPSYPADPPPSIIVN